MSKEVAEAAKAQREAANAVNDLGNTTKAVTVIVGAAIFLGIGTIVYLRFKKK